MPSPTILCVSPIYHKVTAVRPFFTYASHERILVAKVREYDYSTACGVCGSLLSLSQAVDIPSAVLLMKRTVPEFKSQNSPYEQYDLRIEQERQAAGQQPS